MPTITDWLMVLVTAVYVIATIFICLANIKSAKATREQVVEAKRQYKEEQRPYVTYQLIFEHLNWYGMRFTNHGRRVANHVKILLDPAFIDSISAFVAGSNLKDLSEREITLGIGQSYDIFFGGEQFRNQSEKQPISGRILYQDNQNSYCESFDIDFEKYGTFFSVTNSADDFHNEMQNLNKNLGKIGGELAQIRASLSSLNIFLQEGDGKQ